MSGLTVPESRSGIRPALAFLMIGGGLIAVALQLVRMAEPAPRPARALAVTSPAPHQPARYDLVDRHGELLSESVAGYALEASPFHLWLRHTPERILQGVLTAVGPEAFAAAWNVSVSDLEAALSRSLFDTREDGSRIVERWPLTNAEGRLLAEWFEAGGPRDPEVPAVPLSGLEVVPYTPSAEVRGDLLEGLSGPFFALRIRPAELFSEGQRRALRPKFEARPGAASRWVRALCAGLFERLEGPRLRERDALQRAWQAAVLDEPSTPLPKAWRHREQPQRGALGRWLAAAMESLAPRPSEFSDEHPWELEQTPREWVFSGLMPRRSRLLLDQLPVERVSALRAFLVREELQEGELRLLPTHDRQLAAEQVPLVGRWGWQQPPGTETASERVYEPVQGIERAAYVALRDALVDWTADDAQARFDELTQGRIARLCAQLSLPHGGDPAELFAEYREGRAAPVVESTLDLELQRTLQRRLEQLNAEAECALSMGVVLDLQSREVLALAWDDVYGDSGFAPLQHSFTPGSTFKLVTMALALEGQHVTPTTEFNAGNGHFVVHSRPDGTGAARVIREAEGAISGRRSASDMLAYSNNAGMVQVGLRVPVEEWRAAVPQLGYERPASPSLLGPGVSNPRGSIGERGTEPLRKRWSRIRSHASVSFGHSIMTNLLQHTEALCALTDDGERRPLRFVRGIRWGEQSVAFPPDPGVPVVSRGTVVQLREMMRAGALEGTGGRLSRPTGMELWTKTGTTEKGPSMVCQHRYGAGLAELAKEQLAQVIAAQELPETEQLALIEEHTRQANELRKRLRGQFRPGKSCYVSSIVAIATDQRTGRELLVYIVANDPHWKQRPFGSWVAGPAAIDVLCEATGQRRMGAQLALGAAADPGFDWIGGAPSVELPANTELSDEAPAADRRRVPDQPWAAPAEARPADRRRTAPMSAPKRGTVR
ncbi:MAG: penicillin-binding transpeptidase domain-containing protein [Planctomycetota bacterium]